MLVCSGTTIGGAIAMESYLRAIIEEFDSTQCDLDGCDQGLHNYLLYSQRLLLHNSGSASSSSDTNNSVTISTTNVNDPASGNLALKIVEHNNNESANNDHSTKQERIQRIEYFSLGYGPVNTLGLFCGFGGKGLLKKRGLIQNNDTAVPTVLNWDGMVSPAIHQIDRCHEISSALESYADLLWSLWVTSSEELI